MLLVRLEHRVCLAVQASRQQHVLFRSVGLRRHWRRRLPDMPPSSGCKACREPHARPHAAPCRRRMKAEKTAAPKACRIQRNHRIARRIRKHPQTRQNKELHRQPLRPPRAAGARARASQWSAPSSSSHAAASSASPQWPQRHPTPSMRWEDQWGQAAVRHIAVFSTARMCVCPWGSQASSSDRRPLKPRASVRPVCMSARPKLPRPTGRLTLGSHSSIQSTPVPGRPRVDLGPTPERAREQHGPGTFCLHARQPPARSQRGASEATAPMREDHDDESSACWGLRAAHWGARALS